MQPVFPHDHIKFAELTQTYRSTYEIMSFANQILSSPELNKKYPLAKPLNRRGREVRLIEAKENIHLISLISEEIQQLGQRFENIAVICKTQHELDEVSKELSKLEQRVKTVRRGDEEYSGGRVIILSHLAKGMEFEACIVVNANNLNYSETELDGRMLYVTCTRALHELSVFWIGTLSPHLSHAFS